MTIDQFEKARELVISIRQCNEVLDMVSEKEYLTRIVARVEYKDNIGWKPMDDSEFFPLPPQSVVELRRFYEKMKAFAESELSAL